MVLPSDMRLLIYFMLWYQSRRYQEERICGRQTMNSTMYHSCHRRSVPELSLLSVRVLAISYSCHRQVHCVKLPNCLQSTDKKLMCVMVNPGMVSKGPWVNLGVFRSFRHLTFELDNNVD